MTIEESNGRRERFRVVAVVAADLRQVVVEMAAVLQAERAATHVGAVNVIGRLLDLESAGRQIDVEDLSCIPLKHVVSYRSISLASYRNENSPRPVLASITGQNCTVSDARTGLLRASRQPRANSPMLTKDSPVNQVARPIVSYAHPVGSANAAAARNPTASSSP